VKDDGRKGKGGMQSGGPAGPDWSAGPEKRKRKIKIKLISSFRKTIKENRVAEIIGKNSQKFVEKLGMQECGLEWILETIYFRREFMDFKGI
jgi:hypothetical protein